jgi:hypothetical protein
VKLGRSALYPIGGVGIAAFVGWTILSEWPAGDPGGARQAAAAWRSLAGRVDSNTTVTEGVAGKVWTDHPSEGAEAFRRFWSTGGPGGSPGGVAAYPAQVSAYCRRVAEACEGYAEAVETVRRALKVLAVTSYTQFMFACSWPWIGAKVSALTKWLLDRLYKKAQAHILLKSLESTVMKIVIQKSAGYVAGSAAFALGDEALALGTKLGFGEDPGSFSDNASATLKDFAACVVFFGVWDLTKLGPMAKVFRDNDVGHFASFYVGSNAYTVAYNAEQGKSGHDLLPSMSQLMAKLFVGTAQRGKDPGYPAGPRTQP